MSRRSIGVWSSLTLLCLLSPTAAAAQSREHLWLSIGFAVGMAGGSSDNLVDGSRAEGWGYALGIGWGLTNRLLIGGEVNYWTGRANVDNLSLNMANVSGTVTIYPHSSSGFFVKAGAGVSDFGVGGFADRPGGRLAGFPPLAHANDTWETVFGGDRYDRLGRGLGFVAGVGYDVPIAGPIAFTTTLNVWYGQPGNLELSGQPLAGGWRQDVLDVTVGIRFR